MNADAMEELPVEISKMRLIARDENLARKSRGGSDRRPILSQQTLDGCPGRGLPS